MIKHKLGQVKAKLIQVLKLESTPRKIAIGIAIAVFWNFLPSLGVGPFLSAFAARVLRGSIVAAVTVNLGTGALIPLFYTLNVMMGQFIIGGESTRLQLANMLTDLFEDTFTYLEGALGETTVESLLAGIETFSVGFFIGAAINSLLAGSLLYIIFYYLLLKRQKMKQKLDLEHKNY